MLIWDSVDAKVSDVVYTYLFKLFGNFGQLRRLFLTVSISIHYFHTSEAMFSDSWDLFKFSILISVAFARISPSLAKKKRRTL